MEKGVIIDLDDPLARIPIDRAEFNLDWDATRQALVMPFQVVSGGNRITLLAQFDAPREGSSVWGLKVSGGTVVLASAAPADPKPLVLNRVLLRMRVDPAKQRIDIEQGELGNADLGVALTGSLDFSSDDPRLALGIAGTRMSVAAMKRLWPICTAPKVRAWVARTCHGRHGRAAGHLDQRAVVHAQGRAARPIPDDGLLIQIVGNGAEIRPVAGLPAIRDADVNVRISGRTAVINVGRGNVEISPGRKLSITNGVFEVPDTFPKAPPAKARFRLDGSVPAAAELLGMERLRDYSGAPIDPATSRGTLTAQVTLAPAAQGGSRARILDLHDQPGRRELRRRTHGHGPEGRSGAAQGQRQQPGPLDPGRRQDQRRSGRARLSQAARQRRRCPRPGHARRERDAASSASISAASSAGRCRSSSADAFRRRRATPASPSRPI